VFDIPVDDFIEAVDVLHLEDYKKLPEDLKKGRYFFTHVESKGKAKRSSGATLRSSLNQASKKRLVGVTLRRAVQLELRKRNRSCASLHLSFPFPKEEVIDVFEACEKGRRNGRAWRFFLSDPALLDELCGRGWDVFPFSDTFYNIVHSLKLSNLSTQSFQLSFQFSVCPGPFSHQDYRQRTLSYFHLLS